MDYKNKYLKYKTKYHDLKKQIGGLTAAQEEKYKARRKFYIDANITNRIERSALLTNTSSNGNLLVIDAHGCNVPDTILTLPPGTVMYRIPPNQSFSYRPYERFTTEILSLDYFNTLVDRYLSDEEMHTRDNLTITHFKNDKFINTENIKNSLAHLAVHKHGTFEAIDPSVYNIKDILVWNSGKQVCDLIFGTATTEDSFKSKFIFNGNVYEYGNLRKRILSSLYPGIPHSTLPQTLTLSSIIDYFSNRYPETKYTGDLHVIIFACTDGCADISPHDDTLPFLPYNSQIVTEPFIDLFEPDSQEYGFNFYDINSPIRQITIKQFNNIIVNIINILPTKELIDKFALLRNYISSKLATIILNSDRLIYLSAFMDSLLSYLSSNHTIIPSTKDKESLNIILTQQQATINTFINSIHKPADFDTKYSTYRTEFNTIFSS